MKDLNGFFSREASLQKRLWTEIFTSSLHQGRELLVHLFFSFFAEMTFLAAHAGGHPSGCPHRAGLILSKKKRKKNCDSDTIQNVAILGQSSDRSRAGSARPALGWRWRRPRLSRRPCASCTTSEHVQRLRLALLRLANIDVLLGASQSWRPAATGLSSEVRRAQCFSACAGSARCGIIREVRPVERFGARAC